MASILAGTAPQEIGRQPKDRDTTHATARSVLKQARVLFGAIAQSPGRRMLAILTVAIIAIISANAVGQIYLNDWRGAWYDALERRDLDAFFHQLMMFGVIVAFLLAFVVGETWLHQMVRIRLREWLTHDLLNVWLHPRRATLIGYAGEIGDNPDQRMHEDARHLSELTVLLGIGLLRSSLLLISFIGVLWVLSSQVNFSWNGESFAIPGYMVWCVLIYASGGSYLTWIVGRPLIRLNAIRYAREADLRFAMVRVNENAGSISLFGGEAHERRTLNHPVERVVDITRQLAGSIARLTWITSGYGWSGLVVPIIVAAPGYFQGDLTFGGMMIVVGAFNQVENSLSWFVSNFSNIADWRATLLRVTTFRTALLELEETTDEASNLTTKDARSQALILQNLDVTSDNKLIRPARSRIVIAPRRHTLIRADAGEGGQALFRALASVHPEGGGFIHKPAGTSMMFVPQKPYLPLGDIATVVRYPELGQTGSNRTTCTDDIEEALRKTGLVHLIPNITTEDRWDQKLSLDEQQRITIARILVNRPDWLVLDDFLASMDATNRQIFHKLLEEDLVDTTVITIGAGHGLDGLVTQTTGVESEKLAPETAPKRETRAVPLITEPAKPTQAMT